MIGAVYCECMIYDAASLKEKRSVIKSILTRLKQRLNVAAAELNYQDVWQRTEIGIVAIANDKVRVEQELQKALDMIDSVTEMERTITRYEWF